MCFKKISMFQWSFALQFSPHMDLIAAKRAGGGLVIISSKYEYNLVTLELDLRPIKVCGNYIFPILSNHAYPTLKDWGKAPIRY